MEAGTQGKWCISGQSEQREQDWSPALLMCTPCSSQDTMLSLARASWNTLSSSKASATEQPHRGSEHGTNMVVSGSSGKGVWRTEQSAPTLGLVSWPLLSKVVDREAEGYRRKVCQTDLCEDRTLSDPIPWSQYPGQCGQAAVERFSKLPGGPQRRAENTQAAGS